MVGVVAAALMATTAGKVLAALMVVAVLVPQ